MSAAPSFNPLAYPHALNNPNYLSDNSAWITHIPFAMALVAMLKPPTLVELGTFKGDSLCAFCQGIVACGAPTRCFAVDTWQGDAHAGAISDQVLPSLRAHHDPLYGRFSTLIQSTFDAAVSRFDEGSIDLLHIDGLHTYEAVKHDYQTWHSKLSDRAVVLFHDTQVRELDFGVWKFWAEVSAGKPSFEFLHGFGLGVLGVGANLPPAFLDFLSAAQRDRDVVGQYFFTIGQRLELYRMARLMIDGHMRNHQMIEQWVKSRGHGLTPIPNPVTESAIYVSRMNAEVEMLLKNLGSAPASTPKTSS